MRDAHTIGKWAEDFTEQRPAGLVYEHSGGSPALGSQEQNCNSTDFASLSPSEWQSSLLDIARFRSRWLPPALFSRPGGNKQIDFHRGSVMMCWFTAPWR